MMCLGRVLLLSLATCTALNWQLVDGARILGVFPVPSISHQVVHRAIMLELNRRGHQVVVITPNPIENPLLTGYTEIDISSTYKFFQNTNNVTSIMQEKRPPLEFSKTALLSGADMCEMIMKHEKVLAMINHDNKEEHFDLVFLEWMATPCTVAFTHRFSAPMIGVTSLPPREVLHYSVGNPTNPSYIPEIALPYTEKGRTFQQRLETALFSMRLGYFFYNTVMPRQDAIAKRYFGPSTPYIGDLHKQVSMLFLTYVEGFHIPSPNVPAVV